MKPRRATHFLTDGRVIVLNICGEKIPELCGDWVDVHDMVVAASDDKTHFESVNGEGKSTIETEESW